MPFFFTVGGTFNLNSVPAPRSFAWASSGRRTRIAIEGRDEIILNAINNFDEIELLHFCPRHSYRRHDNSLSSD